jgi:hypothetical protein
MLTLKRLFVATSTFGVIVIASACTSPTESEMEIPSADGPLISDQVEDEAAEGAEPSEPSDTQRRPGDLVYGGRPRGCNYHDFWHCRRGHRGWRWTEYGNWGGPNRPGGGHDRCCVRVPRRY